MDSYNLQRFVDAQSEVYESVRRELGRGRKTGHWMWFIFPQIRGLGSSATAQHFAIASVDEARAYLAHEVLGPRLLECTRLIAGLEGPTSVDIFGEVDSQKLRSSLTLFAAAAVGEDKKVFKMALARYFAGRADRLTLDRL
ncbi:MAG TPA: DUF1810 domain-containing protein [Acidisarcina sp.]